MRTQRSAAVILSLLALGALLSACTPSTANRRDDQVTLRLIHVDGGPDLDPAVGWYVDRVAELSKGNITIDVKYDCCGHAPDMEDQLVAKIIGGGDLGWVGTRVFDTLEENSLEALTAPMLIDSYPLEAAVIESAFATRTLRNLESLGIRPLALMPGSLRKPLSQSRPMLSPGDWADEPAVVFHSVLNEQTLTALGATPLELSFEERDSGLLNGSIHVVENSLIFQAGGDIQSVLPYAAANVSLWPRISALIANPTSFSHLSKEQRGVLTQAAADVAARTGELAQLDAAAMKASCMAGARFGVASNDDLAAYASALTPVYDSLERNAAAGKLLGDIRSLKNTVDPGPGLVIPEGCSAPGLKADSGGK